MQSAAEIPAPYLLVNDVVKRFGNVESSQSVLRGLSFHIKRGERVALVGQSGCGKSTLLNIISGIDQADSGEIVIAGRSLGSLSETQRTLFRREHIGFVYQSFNLIQTLTALENVKLPLQLNGHSQVQTEQLASAMIERVGLGSRCHAFPDQLSGGEQQRVAIARAMVHSPSLVLADEHTGNLDAETGRQMIDLFNDIADATEQTVLIVTHSHSVAQTADRVLQLADGQIQSNVDDSLAW